MEWQSLFEALSDSICVSANDTVPRSAGQSISCGCRPTAENQKTCYDHRCINFCTQTECVRCSPTCANNKFQRKAWREVEVRRCEHKGFGVFAVQPVPQGSFIAEFTGEVISLSDLQNRRKNTSKDDVHTYIIELKSKTYVDCTRKGSIARFINHSCEPNCRLEVWTVGNRLRVGVFAMADIDAEEELSFDYQWEPSDRPPTKCYCNTPSCRGYIEVFRSERERLSRVGCGMWVASKDRGGGEPSHVLDAEFLVGKRVKVWDDEEQAFSEGKVISSDGDEMFSVFCLAKKDTLNVRLSADDSNWFWYDETRAVVSIKKKVSSGTRAAQAASSPFSLLSPPPLLFINRVQMSNRLEIPTSSATAAPRMTAAEARLRPIRPSRSPASAIGWRNTSYTENCCACAARWPCTS